ncbi:MAG TPA: PEP-CTERM sorting domain-containing protein [Accumulibacter sp.]|jgi:hypothetical protein|uniref:PEP-CTERM sorting domain-containing protein n=1 Tax=Accumulibacter sp. TaxID=2053492 RepID=UPI001A42A018|nr:PEP-CTERM sorting domain-containing protein [Accumulibacter sp.]MBL8395458.1 PEP-CTERM sorting domain-containing protein [Accumulibacter sp.]HMW57981.1 PEP-CTERM sorting domain-containing protein [Accumulibacter sp.]HNM76714.1 PEP-CTERM sorting domain-containing protein [Accumulibacter sp.]
METFQQLKKIVVAGGFVFAMVFGANSQAATVLYSQDFENPNPGSFVNDGGDINVWNPINTLYGGQPAGFSFAQTFTVEALLIGGSQAWGGTGFRDPQGIAGRHAISMLSSAQDDRLGLSFNVGAYKFLNFKLDVSSIDLNNWGGPFVPLGGQAPTFRFSLYDNPAGGVGIGGGILLDFAEITGTATALKNTFDWTNHIVALDATGNTNGNVILQIDELVGGYAALDNFLITASDTSGDVGQGQAPEPATLALLSFGLAAFAGKRRRK